MVGEDSAQKTPDVAGAPGGGRESSNPVLSVAGLTGTVFSTLCCIGLAPLVGLVSAAGLGFILMWSVLLPMLIVSLVIGAYALWRSYRRHESTIPLLLHIAGGLLVVVPIYFTYHEGPWIWVGMTGILAAALWNVRLEYLYWHREPEVDFSRTG